MSRLTDGERCPSKRLQGSLELNERRPLKPIALSEPTR